MLSALASSCWPPATIIGPMSGKAGSKAGTMANASGENGPNSGTRPTMLASPAGCVGTSNPSAHGPSPFVAGGSAEPPPPPTGGLVAGAGAAPSATAVASVVASVVSAGPLVVGAV